MKSKTQWNTPQHFYQISDGNPLIKQILISLATIIIIIVVVVVIYFTLSVTTIKLECEWLKLGCIQQMPDDNRTKVVDAILVYLTYVWQCSRSAKQQGNAMHSRCQAGNWRGLGRRPTSSQPLCQHMLHTMTTICQDKESSSDNRPKGSPLYILNHKWISESQFLLKTRIRRSWLPYTHVVVESTIDLKIQKGWGIKSSK